MCDLMHFGTYDPNAYCALCVMPSLVGALNAFWCLQCLIRYIDYGNSTIVDASDLRKLPESLQWQVISHPFCLAGLSKPTDENKEARVFMHTYLKNVFMCLGDVRCD